jgi:sugar O-acyltransferase (sialic acid O-acetyltransferase NeuD family)
VDVIVYGAGGHGKVVLNSLKRMNVHRAVGFLDDKRRSPLQGLPVLGGAEVLAKKSRKARGLVLAIGDNRIRAAKARLAGQQGWPLVTVIDPQAVVAEDAVIGAGTVIMPGAIINPGARIGMNAIINSGAIVEHDCVIGDHAHISPGARLAGGVQVGAFTHVGIGATIIDRVTIGAYSVIGAGAVVVHPIGDRVVAVGVPARVIKKNK